MVRARATRVTCVIDDKGRITSRLHDPETGDTFIEGVLPATIAVAKNPSLTLYARWGDWLCHALAGDLRARLQFRFDCRQKIGVNVEGLEMRKLRLDAVRRVEKEPGIRRTEHGGVVEGIAGAITL